MAGITWTECMAPMVQLCRDNAQRGSAVTFSPAALSSLANALREMAETIDALDRFILAGLANKAELISKLTAARALLHVEVFEDGRLGGISYASDALPRLVDLLDSAIAAAGGASATARPQAEGRGADSAHALEDQQEARPVSDQEEGA